jgi:DNA-binding protein HU-beta
VDEVANGGSVVLVGFGKFDTLKTKERTGRNPQTGEPMTIPEGKRPRFAAGKDFKDKVAVAG